MFIRYGLAILVAALGGITAFGCTILAVESEEGMLVGNNEDYYLDVEPKMWVTPGRDGEHGRVCFGFDRKRLFRFAQGGVNDAGLFFDAAVTPEGPEPVASDNPKTPRNMGDRMLAECATVDEALSWLGRHRLHLLKGSHLLLADATGAAAVVELVDGEMQVVTKEGRYQVVTNFSLSQPGKGNRPCPRFDLATSVLKEEVEVTVNTVGQALQRTAVRGNNPDEDGRNGGTLYSNIYNLNALKIALFLRADFRQPTIVDVDEYLGRGEKTYPLKNLVENGGRAQE